MTCKHRWILTPSSHRNHYHYQCARCGNVIWATLKGEECKS